MRYDLSPEQIGRALTDYVIRHFNLSVGEEVTTTLIWTVKERGSSIPVGDRIPIEEITVKVDIETSKKNAA